MIFATRLLCLCALASVMLANPSFAHGPARGDAATPTRSIDFPDTAEYQTLVVDLHTHSVFSDGHVWPNIRVAEALQDGLDALAITEHLEYQPHREDILHPDRNRAYAIALEAAKDTSLLVIAGSEITRQAPAGHINAVFISDANELVKDTSAPADKSDVRGYFEATSEWPVQAAVDAAAEQDAFLFWNHPFWGDVAPDGIAKINKFHKANIKANKLHGIEIANGQDYSAEAHNIALKYNLTMIGVSDVHDLIDWDYRPHQGGHRPVNLVFAKDRSVEAIQEALRAKRTLVWFKNLLIGRAPELDAMLSASIQVSDASYRTGSQILDVTLVNNSDAEFELKNLTDLTFMDHADRLRIAANDSTKFSVKPGKKAASITLDFSVENALLAPGKHPTISLEVQASGIEE